MRRVERLFTRRQQSTAGAAAMGRAEVNSSTEFSDFDDDSTISYIMRRNHGYRRAVVNRKKRRDLCISLGIGLFVIVVILAGKYLFFWDDQHQTPIVSANATVSITAPPGGYLVWNEHCRIPDVDLFENEYNSLFPAISIPNCSHGEPLVQKSYDNDTGRYRLHIVKASKRLRENEQATDEIRCCYQEIQREGVGDYADEGYNLLRCVDFGSNFLVPDCSEGVIVRCFSVPDGKLIYADAHFFIQERPEVQRRVLLMGEQRPFGILMFGIDGVSRFNFHRSMPMTFEHLQQHNWFNLAGYNKVENSTFNNMMALLTGLNSSDFHKVCPIHRRGSMDNCSLIWKTFAANGYATAFAEDDATHGPFSLARGDFNRSPTDYYLRPFMLAIGKNLRLRYYGKQQFCIGTQRPAEYIFDFGIEFASRFDIDRAFGVFFSSSSTRNEYRGASTLDAHMHNYLHQLDERGILNRSVVILFSDQGQLYGPLNETPLGGLEERLPVLFIWLPPWMRDQYPEFVYSLDANKHRLTTAYDIYLTLHHLMAVSTGNQKLDIGAGTNSCPTCQSLLRPLAPERGCEQAGAGVEACACSSFIPMPEELALNLTQLVLSDMNAYLEKNNFTEQCEYLTLKQVVEADSQVDGTLDNISYPYRIVFVAEPNDSEFEAIFNFEMDSGNLGLDVASIKRLAPLSNASECVTQPIAKKFCICKN